MKRILFALGGVIIFFLLGITLFQKTARIDLDIILRAALNQAARLPMYNLADELEHTKIPLLTVYFIPLSKLGLWWAQRLWDVMTVVAYPALTIFLASRLNLTHTVQQKSLVMLALLLTLNPWNTEVWAGQMNVLLWIAILIAAAPVPAPLAGFSLMLALGLKPPYLLFLPWLFRHSPAPKRVILWAAISTALSTGLYVFLFGFPALIADHLEWARFLPLSTKKHIGVVLNYGLPSLTRVYPGASEFWLGAGLVAAELISRRVRDRYLSVCLIALLVVVCSPMAWFQNYTLAVGFVLLLVSDFCESRHAVSRLWLGVGLAALVVSFPMLNPEIMRHTSWGAPFYYGRRIPLWGILIATLVWSTARFLRRPQSAYHPVLRSFREE